MKTILCYGDSNTHGFNPATQGRFSLSERWTGVLMRELGSDYHVIEEGLGGRTTVWDDPIMESRNGRDYLLPCLWSHKPLDLVIIMLGTNDLKDRFSLTPFDIAAGAGALGIWRGAVAPESMETLQRCSSSCRPRSSTWLIRHGEAPKSKPGQPSYPGITSGRRSATAFIGWTPARSSRRAPSMGFTWKPVNI